MRNGKAKTKTKTITWSDAAQRYRSANGRFIARARVLREMEQVRIGVGDEIRELTESFRNGVITQIEWKLGMRALIRSSAVLHAAIASGGVKQMSASDLGRVGAFVKRQYEFLNRFERQIESGEQPLDGRAVQRAMQYARAAYSLFGDMERVKHLSAGYTQAMRVLGVAEHCRDCVDWAGRWLPIEVVPPIGAAQCRVNCKCHIEYRRA